MSLSPDASLLTLNKWLPAAGLVSRSICWLPVPASKPLLLSSSSNPVPSSSPNSTTRLGQAPRTEESLYTTNTRIGIEIDSYDLYPEPRKEEVQPTNQPSKSTCLAEFPNSQEKDKSITYLNSDPILRIHTWDSLSSFLTLFSLTPVNPWFPIY